MATANVIELRACMADCLDFCALHLDHEFVEFHYIRLKQAAHNFEEAVRVSDKYYRIFADAAVTDKQNWRAVSDKAIAIQETLKRHDAHSYPDQVVLYWDVPIFRRHLVDLLAWLAANQDIYRDAAADTAELRRLIETAEKGLEAKDNALDEYSRQAQSRSAALGAIGIYLGEFRQAMRRNLGKKNQDYNKIRWPFTLAPDRPVLF